jgi:signal transduction histidine kinase
MNLSTVGGSLLLLLVDGDAVFSRQVEQVVAGIDSWRISLRSVVDIEAALAEMERHPPDVCLVDCSCRDNLAVQLPETGHNVPIILLGDQGGADLEREAIEAGAVDYLHKAQLKPAVLERLVRNALRWRMATRKLRESEERLRLLNENLEKVVDRRTKALKRANLALRGALDQAHQLAGSLTERNAEIAGKNEELNCAYAELKTTQSRILQQEKMAAIGQLAAGVAHEINNPMGFLSSNLGTLEKYTRRLTDYIEAQGTFITERHASEEILALIEKRRQMKIEHILSDIGELIEESRDGADRVKKIVQDLKTFSRVDEAERQMANINDCIDTTINVVWNEIKYKATLKKDYGQLPLLLCHPLQLSQVFMNLLLNAVQAIERQGELEVKTWAEQGQIHVAVADNGCGMPAEIRQKIFEPFFTTKQVGQGTGLGLSISYDIVKKHRGDIRVESEVGRGTTFILSIPAGEATYEE